MAPGLMAIGRTRSLQQFIVDRTGLVICALGVAMLAAYFLAAATIPKPNGRIVRGDALNHFVQLRSLVFDRDVDFRNDYDLSFSPDGRERMTWYAGDLTPTGMVRNYMPVGPAILWMPLYLVVTLVYWLTAALGLTPAPNGFEPALQLVPSISGVVAATAATWLSWRLARQLTSPASAAAAALVIWLGSHAFYYSMVSPSYSHAASMFVAAIFYGSWLDPRRGVTLSRLVTWGALAGLAALMRWQDAILVAVPVVEALVWPVDWRQRFLGAVAAVLAAAVVFSPQMAIWTVLYGQPFALPQGPSFMQWTSPHPVLVLFSDNHGLFVWAPVLVLATFGIVTLIRRDRLKGALITYILLVTWYVNAAVVDWWGGEAFGARRFLSLFPLFVVGLSVWIEAAGRPLISRTRRIVLAAALAAANVLLLLQYQLAMKGLEAIAPYPTGWVDMWLVRFAVPARLIAWWLQ